MPGDVIAFRVPPKQMQRSYKKHKYTVTYVPATKQWHWEVEIVHITRYGEDALTMQKAFKAAEKHIDHVLKLQGKGVA